MSHYIEELILRMREATSQKVANTTMISAADLSVAADALESLDAAYDGAVEARKALAQQALKAEQERDALAVELKALRARAIELEAETKSSEEMQTLKFCEREWSTERAAMMNTINALRNCGDAHPIPVRELTDEEILNALDGIVRTQFLTMPVTRKELWLTAGSVDVREFVRAIEAEMKALREQEPVAVYKGHRHIPSDTKEFWGMADNHLPAGTHLYARPVPARYITNEAIEEMAEDFLSTDGDEAPLAVGYVEFARAIERYLKGEGK